MIDHLLSFAENEYGKAPQLTSTYEFEEYAMEDVHIQKPTNTEKALELYFALLQDNY